MLQPSRAVPLIGFGVNKSENEAIHGRCWWRQDTQYLKLSSLMMAYHVAQYKHLFKRDRGQSCPNTYCNILPSLTLNAIRLFHRTEDRRGDVTGEEWFVIMFGGRGGGWRPAAHTGVWNQLGWITGLHTGEWDEEGGRERLGKSEGGGGRKGSSQWKNCEKALTKACSISNLIIQSQTIFGYFKKEYVCDLGEAIVTFIISKTSIF